MKRFILCLLLCVVALCGCSSTPDPLEGYSREDAYYLGIEEGSNAGYNEGYDDGYNDGYEKGLDVGWESSYYEEQDSFQRMISNLMYDHEYDIVKSLLEYDRKEVEEALEYEFGTSNIDSIIDYFYELSITEVGTCDICGEIVYAGNDIPFKPEGIACAHIACFTNDENKSPIKIQ